MLRCSRLRVLPAALLAVGLTACSSPPESPPLRVPHGYTDRLELKHEGQRYGFGPFVGYYFKPTDTGNLDTLQFLCFNERGFYASDVPINTLLYEGEARFATLPRVEFDRPTQRDRIEPVFFDEAPKEWVEQRPTPQDEFLHFHSCYDRTGSAWIGFWLRHRARTAFTYDMGGRVNPSSRLYHRVEPGPDLSFARIIEFDRGPTPPP